jgi:protein involved in polysaccharide export with SLBB domain
MKHVRLTFLAAALGAALTAGADEPAAAKPSGDSTPATNNPPAAQAQTAPKAKADEQARKIASHDVLSIRVANELDLSNDQIRVDDDGTISFPFLGSLKVAGLTRSEVEVMIREKLDKDWVLNPQVTVDFKAYDIQYVTVAGPVARPGQVQIPPDHRMDVVEAIGAAGDFLRNADQSDIKVRNTKTGATRIYRYKDLIKSGTAPVFVEPGETIIVGLSVL